MVLGLVLFCVAIVFVINMANACQKVSDKDAGFYNLIIGLFTLFLVILGIIQKWFGDGTFWWAAQVLLFSLTYLFLGITKLAKLDGRGLGWFCLFVVCYLPVPTYQIFQSGDIFLGCIYVSWAFLWFLFWIAMGLQKGGAGLGKLILITMGILLVFTLYLPSILFLNGWWPQ